ncbi:MAG: GAP family protein [Streptosporangiaceae bacterium]
MGTSFGTVLAQAAGLALLAGLSPMAVLVAAVYLGAPSPRRVASSYLAGAVIVSVIMAIVVIVVLQAIHLQHPEHRTPRYGLRLAIGVLALAAAAVIARRKPRPPAEGTAKKPGLTSRLIAEPRPVTAFVVGMMLFGPSLSFIAAVEVIATARIALPLSTAAVAVVVILDALGVWLPVLCHLIAPEPTNRILKAFNGWIQARLRPLIIGGLVIMGLIMTGNGILGLTGVV